jgi:hypothetical protein
MIFTDTMRKAVNKALTEMFFPFKIEISCIMDARTRHFPIRVDSEYLGMQFNEPPPDVLTRLAATRPQQEVLSMIALNLGDLIIKELREKGKITPEVIRLQQEHMQKLQDEEEGMLPKEDPDNLM